MRLLAQQLEAIHPTSSQASPVRGSGRPSKRGRRADELSEDELLVGLLRIAALPESATATPGSSPATADRRDLHFYPLRLYAFPDGTYVVDESGKSGLVGARVTAVGGLPYAEVAKRVRPLVPHDNSSNLQGLLPLPPDGGKCSTASV